MHLSRQDFIVLVNASGFLSDLTFKQRSHAHTLTDQPSRD